jgi:hypothetical protein
MRVILVLLALALLSIPAAAAAPDSTPAEARPVAPAAEGGCAAFFDLGAELGLREVVASLAAAAAEAEDPEWLRPAKRLGYCHCGCGARCQTSADCGGSPCRPFITCC